MEVTPGVPGTDHTVDKFTINIPTVDSSITVTSKFTAGRFKSCPLVDFPLTIQMLSDDWQERRTPVLGESKLSDPSRKNSGGDSKTH